MDVTAELLPINGVRYTLSQTRTAHRSCRECFLAGHDYAATHESVRVKMLL
jgi:hypothetical protein